MALAKRSFANLESVEDDNVRDVLRILFDRIHDLESRASRGVDPQRDIGGERLTNVGDATESGDAVSLGFADIRYEPFKLSNVGLERAAVDKLVGLGLTEAEARSLL